MKIAGILLVIIAVLNMVAWIGDSVKGTRESPLYYIFIFVLLFIGIWMISTAAKKKKMTIKKLLMIVSPPG